MVKTQWRWVTLTSLKDIEGCAAWYRGFRRSGRNGCDSGRGQILVSRNGDNYTWHRQKRDCRSLTFFHEKNGD